MAAGTEAPAAGQKGLQAVISSQLSVISKSKKQKRHRQDLQDFFNLLSKNPAFIMLSRLKIFSAFSTTLREINLLQTAISQSR